MSKKIEQTNPNEPSAAPSDEILGLIFSSIPTGIAYLDPQFNIMWVNQGFARAVGWDADKICGRNYFDLFANPELKPIFRQVAETGGSYSSYNSQAFGGDRADGDSLWDFRLQALHGVDQSIRGLVMILEDVTQRAKTENDLQKTRELFEHVFESDPDANFLVNENGKIQAANLQAVSMFGYSRDDLMGKPIETLIPQHLRKEHIQNRQRYQADPHSREMGAGLDLYAKRKDGSQFPVDITLSPLRRDEGLLVLAVVRDITQRKMAEEALRKSEEQLQAVTNGMPVILWAIDQDGVFTLLRGRGLAAITEDMRNLVGKPAWDVLKDYPEILEYIHRALNGEEISVDIKTSLGESFQSSYTPQVDENGRVVGVIGLAFNITARKQAESELKKSEERFRSSVENLLESFTILTARRNKKGAIVDFVVEYTNEVARRAEESNGFQMVGRSLSELLPGVKQSQLFAAFCGVVETGKPLSIKGMDYEDRWGGNIPFARSLDVQASRLGDGIAASWRDVTEENRMAAVLRQQEALLRTVVDTLPVGVWVFDEKGETILGNRVGLQIWGGPLPQRLNQPGGPRVWLRKTGKPINPREWPIAGALARGETSLEEEVEFESPEGGHRTILNSVVPLKSETGQVTGAVMVSQEITERIRMEAELAEVRRRLMDGIELERRRLAQELHDGPIQDLYGISFQLQSLEEEHLSDAGLSGIHEAEDEVQAVVQVLRDLCVELRPPALVHFGLQRAILSHIEKFQASHPEIEVDLRLAEDRNHLPEPVRMALYRIYQHTISNIARHANASRIEIEFDMVDQQATLEIRDNGVGFEVPRRWVELAREGHLGLIGSAERAESVGGKLEIESRPGGGTVIRVVMPLPNEGDIAPVSRVESA